MKSKVIQVSIGVILNNKSVFLQRREGEDQFKGKWEFPGGKIEVGESAEKCLKRELYEEVGFIPELIEKICEFKYNYRNFSVLFHIYFCKTEKMYENDLIMENKWVYFEDLYEVDFPKANYEFLNKVILFVSKKLQK